MSARPSIVEYLDQPPAGWHVLEVMKKHEGGREWVALMIDVDPDEFTRPGSTSKAQSRWVRIPGKHRNRDAACDMLDSMLATRH